MVDDTQIQLDILAEDLKPYDDFEIILSTTDPRVALNFLEHNHERIDVAFIDMQMPGISGKYIAEKYGNKINFVVISAYADYSLQMHKYHGIIDYLLKPVMAESLQDTIEKLYLRLDQQRIYKKQMQSPAQSEPIAVKPLLSDRFSEIKFTGREKEVLDLLQKGMKNKQIADKLFISDLTVATHIQNIFQKTNVNSRNELMSKLLD